MRMRKGRQGHTLIEIIIVFACLMILAVGVLYYGLLLTVAKGNFWIEEKSLLRKIKIEQSEVNRVLDIERHVFDLSKVIVEKGSGERMVIFIDSDLLFNYVIFYPGSTESDAIKSDSK